MDRNALLEEAKRRGLDVSKYETNGPDLQLVEEAKRRGLLSSNNEAINSNQDVSSKTWKDIVHEIGWEEFMKNPNWQEIMTPKEPSHNLTDYLNIFDNSGKFQEAWEDFYRREGVHGANREFAKIFGIGEGGREHQAETERRFLEAMKTHPEQQQAGAALARMYSSIPFALTAGNIAPGAGLIGQGALTGALMGGFETPYGDESRLGNMAEESALGALTGGLIKGLGYGAKALKGETTLPNWLTRERAGASAGKKALSMHNELASGYENLKNTVRTAGIKGETKLPVTKTITSDIIDPTTGKPTVRIIKTMESPSFEQIQKDLPGVSSKAQDAVYKGYETGDIGDLMKAESALGQEASNMWNDYYKTKKPLDWNALYAIEKQENKINKIIEDMIEKVDLSEQPSLRELRKGWQDLQKRFMRIPAIKEFVKGDLTPQDLARRLQGNTKEAQLFRARAAEEMPEIGQNKIKNDVLEFMSDKGKLGLFLKALSGMGK